MAFLKMQCFMKRTPLMAGVATTAFLGTLALSSITSPLAAKQATDSDAVQVYPISLPGSYLAARSASGVRDVPAAVRYFDQALVGDPANMDLIRRALSLRLANGELARALSLIDNTPDLQNNDHFVALARGVDALIEDDMRLAGEAFGSETDGALSQLTSTLLEAWAMAGAGNGEEALQLLEMMQGPEWYEGFRTYHSGLIADFMGNSKIARDHLLKAYETDPNAIRTLEALTRAEIRSGSIEDATKRVEEARAFGEERPYYKALKALLDDPSRTEPLANDPRAGAMEVLYGIGAALGREGGDEIALIYLHLAVKLQPESALPKMVLAEVYEQEERYKDAIALYKAIPEGSNFYQQAAIETALNYNAQEKPDDAEAVLNDFLEEQPNNLSILRTLGNVLRSNEKFEEARDVYSRVIDQFEARPQAEGWSDYYFRGITNERIKRWPEAEKDFLKALELEPKQPQVLNYLGYSWVDQNLNLDEAIEMIREAVELRPNDGYIVDSLGWAFYKLEDYESAVKNLELAVLLRPEDPTINDHLGDAYWKIGRKREAIFKWSHARDLDPEADLEKQVVRKIKVGLDKAIAEGTVDKS